MPLWGGVSVPEEGWWHWGDVAQGWQHVAMGLEPRAVGGGTFFPLHSGGAF